MTALEELGWDDAFAAEFRPHASAGLVAARVAVQHRGGYRLWGESGEFAAEASGRFRHRTARASDFPVVGDWVAAEISPPPDGGRGHGLIHGVLPRRTRFSRTAAGAVTEEQVIAANIDDVFIVEALATPLNLRRIERFLALAWESGAVPIVLLTKCDLCGELDAELDRAASFGVPVHAVCSLTGEGIHDARQHLRPGRTAALLGPSGVGKSTFINHLTGREAQWVQAVRESDQKGRHTTTHRELVRLPGGGLIIDTPGLRELQLWEGSQGVDESFADIDEVANHCRFSDCRHEGEPGCAIRQAVEDGTLDPGRLESFRKLVREAEAFERRHNARAQAEERRRWKQIAKGLRAHKRSSDES